MPRDGVSVSSIFPMTWRLRFDDDLESGFVDYHVEHSLPFARLALILAVVLYALFGILDYFAVPGVAKWIWLIRYAIFCPTALAVLGMTFTQRFKPVMRPVLCGLAIVCGLGIVAMIAIAPATAGFRYYAGLLLVIPWAFSMLQLRFSAATKACLVIIVGYELVAILLKSTPTEILVNNNFFLISSVIIGMFAGYTIERGFRTHFLQRRTIEAQRAELAVHNRELDFELQKSLDGLRRQAAELQASRARVVAAADSERRRIERNLHDGAQQRLTALAVKLRMVSDLADDDRDLAETLLEEARCEVSDAVRELRDLAHGIYPPLLAESGLPAALSSAARWSTLPITVDAAHLRRYPAEVETTVYFCCLEAIQNACKYAGREATLALRLREDAGTLTFRVTDDGQGFDAGARGLGAGFLNMADRLGALGGSLEAESAPRHGTTLSGDGAGERVRRPARSGRGRCPGTGGCPGARRYPRYPGRRRQAVTRAGQGFLPVSQRRPGWPGALGRRAVRDQPGAS
jgi:signal transduction histidine kinase